MYLARRRNGSDGIFQASRFKTKPSGRTGLKSGGYFVSFAVCKAFEAHYKQQVHRKPRPAPRMDNPQQSYMFSQMGPLYSNYLGYPGAQSGTPPTDPRLAQLQQQMQLYQLRLKMSQMNQFKGMPPQNVPLGQPTPGFTPGQPGPQAPLPVRSPEAATEGTVALNPNPSRPNLPTVSPDMRAAYQQQMTLQYLLQNQARAAYMQQVYGPKPPHPPPAYGASNATDSTPRPALAV